VEAGQELYYEALSHMWDREAPPHHTITIDKHTVRIRPRILSALRHLRLRDRSRVLWVDALCINMFDSEEHSAQVRLMGHIFHNAKNVCVWLGDESFKFGAAFALLERLLDITNAVKILKDEELTPDWKPLFDLLSHPIFRRRWIVQEIAMAVSASIHCGTLQMKWSDFEAAVTVLEHMETAGNAILRLLHSLGWMGEFEGLAAPHFIAMTSKIFRKSNAGETTKLLSLEQLVFNFASFQCEPPDVIYALVGLSNDSKNTHPTTTFTRLSSNHRGLARAAPVFSLPISASTARQTFADVVVSLLAVRKAFQRWHTNIEPGRLRLAYEEISIDYHKPIHQIYQEFVAFAIAKSKSLGILCRPWAPVRKGLRFPSWIAMTDRGPFGPNPVNSILKSEDTEADIYIRLNGDPLIGLPGHEPYNASAHIPPRWEWQLNNGHDILTVDGFILDHIQDIEIKAMGGYIAKEWLELGGWLDRSQAPPDQFWRTLVADRAPDGGRPPAFYARICHEIFRKTNSDLDTDGLLRKDVQITSLSVPSFFTEFVKRMQRVIWNKKLIRTSRGYLGLAPASAKAGDLICILYGCTVPVILTQPLPSSRYSHILHGDCYVHGMMDGEALGVQKDYALPSRSFNIG